MRLENILASITGKTFMYKTRHHKVCAWLIIEEIGEALIGTDSEIIRLPLEKAASVIKMEFLESDSDSDADITSPVHSVLSTLMEQIDLVKKDPKAIDQAKAITATANSITSLLALTARVGGGQGLLLKGGNK